MYIKAKSIIGYIISSIDNQTQDLEAKDVVYNSKTNKVRGILVDKKSSQKSSKIIFLEDIKSIGFNIININISKSIKNNNESGQDCLTSHTNNSNFYEQPEVITQGGNILGRIIDIFFDFPSGIIDAIEIGHTLNSSSNKILMKEVIAKGESSYIVNNSTEDKLINSYQSYRGKNKSVKKPKKISILDRPGVFIFSNTNEEIN
jgi:uncharacterized protein YrrD